VRHGFRLNKRNDYFWVNFDHFELGIIFKDRWAGSVKCLNPKIKPLKEILACPNQEKSHFKYFCKIIQTNFGNPANLYIYVELSDINIKDND